ncbi:MAG: hypothetical protein QM731_15650 [Chitinophagaceae bacterium]
MATKKKTAKKAASKKPVVKKQAKKATLKKPVKAIASRIIELKKKNVLYVDSTFFFPYESSVGYQEISQSGRIANLAGGSLVAALPLPVGATLSSITFYYKNVSYEAMSIAVLKKHINHHCYSGEVEVSLDTLPPATVAPDDFAEKVVDHFDANGLIQDQYIYFVEVGNTIKDENGQRSLRGIRIEYLF